LNVAGHGDAVAQYSEMIGRSLGLSPEEVRELGFAGRVHDVGKLFVPERILNKHHALADEEFQILKMHPRVGGEIVGTLPSSSRMQKAIEAHHEWVDGTGYPLALKGEDIPVGEDHRRRHAYVNLISDRSMAGDQRPGPGRVGGFSGVRFDGVLVRIWRANSTDAVCRIYKALAETQAPAVVFASLAAFLASFAVKVLDFPMLKQISPANSQRRPQKRLGKENRP
jgi:hypothetical protein